MLSSERIRGFVWRFLALFALFVVGWPVVKDAYAAYFRVGGNQLFRSFGAHGLVYFKPPSKEYAGWDTPVRLVNRQNSRYSDLGFQARYAGYLPTTVLMALVLASPVAWSRRGWALVWGMLLVNGFVAARMAIAFIYGFRKVDLFVFSPFWNRAVDIAYQAVSFSTVTSCVVPALIWILVTFRRSDWAAASPNKLRKHPGRSTRRRSSRSANTSE